MKFLKFKILTIPKSLIETIAACWLVCELELSLSFQFYDFFNHEAIAACWFVCEFVCSCEFFRGKCLWCKSSTVRQRREGSRSSEDWRTLGLELLTESLSVRLVGEVWLAECPGHFGHLELAKPMFHIGFLKTVFVRKREMLLRFRGTKDILRIRRRIRGW